jgi:hypothetical protein
LFEVPKTEIDQYRAPGYYGILVSVLQGARSVLA